MSHFYRVVYCSQNLIGGGALEQQAAITQILETARANNSKKNVTGALLYSDGYFAQVLEGPRASVQEIFEKIQRDARHGEVTVLEGSDADQRDFPDWSMARVGEATPAESHDVSETLHHAMRDPGNAGHDVLHLMRSLVVQEG